MVLDLPSEILLDFNFILDEMAVIHFSCFMWIFIKRLLRFSDFPSLLVIFLFKWIPPQLQGYGGLTLAWLMYERPICKCKCSNILLTWLRLPFRLSSFKTTSQTKTSFVFVVLLVAMSIMVFVISYMFLLPLNCRAYVDDNVIWLLFQGWLNVFISSDVHPLKCVPTFFSVLSDIFNYWITENGYYSYIGFFSFLFLSSFCFWLLLLLLLLFLLSWM